ncbi:dihydropteroate synthase [Candidatus Anaplasma sp. TIGMIC]|uniref:dihydropteroate synthase n=1 Tax=Candidatus Anaplasma sp. TIGMIC TaxID=3020713 RepID=UPI00232BE11A|nr:dihydropteroate synthase [Candidatus Anaplasma sp. TIGMIC]MDB1135196.1 dihydropteroate synthase [Candidatus Anaplasma sp. TIGMIC]
MSTKIAGILNVTPNSFSDGGKFLESAAAIQHAEKLIRDGADIIDVGAESTAPDATSVECDEEWKRLENVLPEVVRLAHDSGVEVSIDTRNAKTAARALECGVDYINDQGGLLDIDMSAVAAQSTVPIIIMHNLGIPTSRAHTAEGPPEKLVDEMLEWFMRRVDILLSKGVQRERIILDPGLGFGKRPEYSWYIVRNIHKFMNMGFKTYVGHSRKSMFSAIPVALEDRDAPTAMLSMFLVQKGVDFLRVHDVALTKTAQKIASLLGDAT